MSDDCTLYEFALYDAENKFLTRFPCVPPFEVAPWIVISGTRYFVLTDDMTYYEAEGVHWLPPIAKASPGPEPDPG